MTIEQYPQSKPLYEQVLELIESKIINGDFQIGDRLPTENELASQYRVSRTVIREAMKVLKEKGWVETRVARGTFVVSDVSKGVGTSFDVVMRMNPSGSFAHLVEVRMILEPEIAALAAVRADEEEIARMQQAVGKMEDAISNIVDIDEFLRGDFAFHMAMADSSGNPLIPMILSPVVKLMRDAQKYHLYLVKGGNQRSQHNHRLILASIEKHDADAARFHMHEHILQVRTDIEHAMATSQNG